MDYWTVVEQLTNRGVDFISMQQLEPPVAYKYDDFHRWWALKSQEGVSFHKVDFSRFDLEGIEDAFERLQANEAKRVFRNEAISARSHCIFHQIEGLYIDKGVSFWRGSRRN